MRSKEYARPGEPTAPEGAGAASSVAGSEWLGVVSRCILSRAILQKLPSTGPGRRLLARRVVIPSTIRRIAGANAAPPHLRSLRDRRPWPWRFPERSPACSLHHRLARHRIRGATIVRHETCFPPVFLEKDSHSLHESVDFFHRGAKVVWGVYEGPAMSPRWPVRRPIGPGQDGWNHGAERNGNRKRSRVRVACGGAIRPHGLGHQPIHGHYGPSLCGLSVVGRDSPSPVVRQPARECRIRQRHLSRGPGLPAALIAPGTCRARRGWHESPASRQPPVMATRHDRVATSSAAPVLTRQPERPAAGRGAHHPGPRMRLRSG